MREIKGGGGGRAQKHVDFVQFFMFLFLPFPFLFKLFSEGLERWDAACLMLVGLTDSRKSCYEQ